MKTRLIRALMLLVFVSAALSLASCKRKAAPTPDANKPAPAPAKVDIDPAKIDTKLVKPDTIVPKSPDSVLVTVNGVDITQKELDDLLKPHLERLAKQAANLPPAFLEQQKAQFRQRALEEMITMQLLNEKVKLANIVVTDQDILDEMARVASKQRPPVTVEEFKQRMLTLGYEIEQLKSQIRVVLGQQKLMIREFPDEAKFTEEDAKAFYEANKVKYETPEQVRASHILIKTDFTDPNSDPNQIKATARARAEELLKQVKEGADFAALAKTSSEGPSAPGGGDLNFFGRGRMVPPFDKAAFELEVGKVSDVVETKFGYHIIKLTDRKEAKTTSFDEAKDEIVAEQVQRRLRDLAIKHVEKLKADAKIVYAPGMEPKPAPSGMPGGPGAPGGRPPSPAPRGAGDGTLQTQR